jgi:hypothetical protein
MKLASELKAETDRQWQVKEVPNEVITAMESAVSRGEYSCIVLLRSAADQFGPGPKFDLYKQGVKTLLYRWGYNVSDVAPDPASHVKTLVGGEPVERFMMEISWKNPIPVVSGSYYD